jgi:HD-like signal output (HDOD) protein
MNDLADCTIKTAEICAGLAEVEGLDDLLLAAAHVPPE